ncbi:20994_t:CDS:2, partial [Racocetra persica]
ISILEQSHNAGCWQRLECWLLLIGVSSNLVFWEPKSPQRCQNLPKFSSSMNYYW